MSRSSVESYDFTGTQIVLFATSGGSGFGKTADDLKESVTDKTIIKEGRILNGNQTIEMLSEWAASYTRLKQKNHIQKKI